MIQEKLKTYNWEDVLTIKNGKNQKKVVDPDGKYPIYGSGGIMGYANDFLCEEGTTIIGRKGSINKPIFVNTKFWNVDTAFGLCPKENLDSKYFYYFCLTYNFLKHNKATTLPSLTKTDLLKIKIPLPPLPAQKKIAALLDQADALRQLNRQLLEKYDALAQSLFLEMFGDPVSNPKGWEKIKLGDISKMSSGSTPSRKIKENFVGSIPWIKTTEVNGKIIYNTLEKISEEALRKSSCKLFPKNSIVIAMYGQGKTRGQVGILGIEATTNQACCVLEPSNKMNFDFLFSLFSHLYMNLRELSRGGNQPNLNLGLLKNYTVLNPPIHLQNQFAGRVGEIEAQKAKARESLEKSEALFQGLLQRAFL